MKKTIILLGLLLITSKAYGESCVVYDPSHTVTNKVIRYVPSGDMKSLGFISNGDDLASTLGNYLIDTSLASVTGIPVREWKVSNYKVIPMTQANKDLLQSIADQNAADALALRISLFDDSLSSNNPNDVALTKAYNKIDSIDSYAKLKPVLKRMVRKIYELHN